ncbi:uncharacterized protein G2W53_040114 [Senna tora]|uniref:Secreted protein n=1 Tax=Senna tora TaxID=362788 RepID=A0A834SNW8_9FABA|nr:uncharacterized protein G2W53_040114 [Senna tora]
MRRKQIHIPVMWHSTFLLVLGTAADDVEDAGITVAASKSRLSCSVLVLIRFCFVCATCDCVKLVFVNCKVVMTALVFSLTLLLSP